MTAPSTEKHLTVHRLDRVIRKRYRRDRPKMMLQIPVNLCHHFLDLRNLY
jgi:hypothetical protein